MIIDKDLVERVSKKTITDYEPYNTKREGKVLIDTEGIICMIEDLLLEIDRLDEELNDLKTYYEDRYFYSSDER